jgi:ABC-2 type transport system ATP-binding protein
MEPAIQVDNLTKIFKRPLPRLRRWLRRPGESVVTALTDISLTVQPGEIFGLVGRNGAGKTTLVKAIAALMAPTRGSVKVFGVDVIKQSQDVKRCIGLVTSDERSFYWRLTGWQNLMFFSRLYGLDEAPARRRIEELLDMFELQELSRRRFHEYSTGNKQRLAIVRALLTDPPLMLLDEPTRSLDPIAADELRHLIRQRMHESGQKTVLITTHNLAEIEQLCGRVAILSRGQLKECGTLAELRAKYSGQEQVTLRVRRLSMEDGLSQLRHEAPTLVWEAVSPDTLEVKFFRQGEDDTLNRVLETLLHWGAEVVACDTTRLGLKEIMEIIEGHKPDAPVGAPTPELPPVDFTF